MRYESLRIPCNKQGPDKLKKLTQLRYESWKMLLKMKNTYKLVTRNNGPTVGGAGARGSGKAGGKLLRGKRVSIAKRKFVRIFRKKFRNFESRTLLFVCVISVKNLTAEYLNQKLPADF